MLEDKAPSWKEAASRGSSFFIENLLRSTVGESLREREEEEKPDCSPGIWSGETRPGERLNWSERTLNSPSSPARGE